MILRLNVCSGAAVQGRCVIWPIPLFFTKQSILSAFLQLKESFDCVRYVPPVNVLLSRVLFPPLRTELAKYADAGVASTSNHAGDLWGWLLLDGVEGVWGCVAASECFTRMRKLRRAESRRDSILKWNDEECAMQHIT